MNCPKCGGYAVEATSTDLPYDYMCSDVRCGFKWRLRDCKLDAITVDAVIDAVKALSGNAHLNLANAELVMARSLLNKIARIKTQYGLPLAPLILIEPATLFGFPVYPDKNISPDVIQIRSPRHS